MSQKPTGVYELFTAVTRPDELRVLEWSCSEEICGPFRLDLVASCALASAEDLAQRLLGHAAVFAMHGSDIDAQARRGTVVEARFDGGLDGKHARLLLSVVPRLSLMDLRVNSRIFQDKTVADILGTIFAEWQVEAKLQLTRAYAKRVYTTQYQESDLDFVLRLCAKEGIGFFLDHAPLDEREMGKPNGERVVLYDGAAYPEIPHGRGKSGSSTLVHHNERFEAQEHMVSGFGLSRRLRPEFVRMGDFDFRKPRLALRALAGVPKADRTAVGDALGGEKLSVYRHTERGELEGDPKVPAEIDESIAKLRLAALRRDRDAGKGTSHSMRLAPGLKFSFDEHPAGGINGDYVITRVEHKGKLPEGGESDGRVYENVFECVPSTIVFTPQVPDHKVVQSIETAIVVGAGGKDIHCDESGRVKVQFHWDLDGKNDDTSSCWLRVSQPWAGTNWGTQFIPRVGTEVLVGFLAGDVDRPVILGSLYNAVRPWPFKLPQEGRKSGFRTPQAPNGGASELVFDDEKGNEKLSLKAQRDFLHSVENDYDLTVKRGETVRVDGARMHTIGGDATSTVLGGRVDTIAKDFELTVLGSHELAISGNADVRVTGNRTTRVEGREKVEFQKPTQTSYVDDQTVRVTGHLVTVVGQHDARRSSTLHVEGSSMQYSTGTTEIVSEKDIVLRVGDSSIHLTKDGIELVAKKVIFHGDELQAETKEKLLLFCKKQMGFVAENVDTIADKKIRLKAQSGEVTLDQNARIDGTVVKLNCSPDPVDDLKKPDFEPPKPTKIKLADEQGNPLPGRRYVVIEGDGSERSGMLDENGEVELFLDDAAEVVFPDVDKARKG